MNKLCFVIMGYGKKTDPETGKTLDLDATYKNIIKPAVSRCEYQCIRGDEIVESGIIDKNMFALLIHAEIVIADISTLNPNALYELGIRHAAKPYATIVMKEEGGGIPFDVSHNKLFTYKHYGEDIGVDESNRCITYLSSLIKEVGSNTNVDSPLFSSIRGLKAYELPKEELDSVISNLSEKEDVVFATVAKAKEFMKNGDFASAAKLWEKVSLKVKNDSYYIQQLALCTYKDKTKEPAVALADALIKIQQLQPTNRKTTDPETLGISGAIYKRLWLQNKKSPEFLNRAIEFYNRGFTINQDYYTGENYATCLILRSTIEEEDSRKQFYIEKAKEVQTEIIKIINNLEDDEDFEKRSDLKWIYATLANCYYFLDDTENYCLNDKRFKEEKPEDWELQSYEETFKLLKEYK